jgi:hypothetical protein
MSGCRSAGEQSRIARQSFVDTDEIAFAMATATVQLNIHAKPWVWGRPQPPTRKLRRTFVYRLRDTCHVDMGLADHPGPR